MAETWSIKNAHYKHWKAPKKASGHDTLPAIKGGIRSIVTSKVNTHADEEGSFWAYLVKEGYTVATWNQVPCMDTADLPSTVCKNKDVFDAAYPTAEQALAHLATLTTEDIALGAHSRGGLVGRKLLKQPAAKLPAIGRVKWFVTLHTPHHGSSMATKGTELEKQLGNPLKGIDLGFVPKAVREAALKLVPGVGKRLVAAVDLLVAVTGMFKGSELGPRVQVELMQALVGSITNGPLKNSTTDPATGAAPGHFYLDGRAKILRASADLHVSIDKTGAEFRFKSELADLGSVELTAATEGESMATATDFIVGLAVDTEGADKLLANLGTALKASAATRKQAQAGLATGTADAQKALQAEHDRLDAEAGKDFRAAKKAVKKTRKKFKKAQRALARAKDKCKDDLGPAWRLCDVMDAAEEALKVTRRSFKAAEDSLDGIQKSTSYVRLQVVKGSLAAIKAGKSAADAAFSGWSAVDKVGQMVVDGGDLVEIEGLELTGSLRQLKGTIAVTANVGGAEVTEILKVDLTSPSPLDLVALADQIADEVTTQASKEGSPVYKALRAKK